MVEQPQEPDRRPSAPALPAPRDAAFRDYWQRAHTASCVSIVMMDRLRDILAREPGAEDLPAFVDTVRTLELLYGDLGAAVQGIVAVASAEGIA